MNNLQQIIIEKYRKAYPKDTLKEISKKTKIQYTRVFRIFNGSEMKISEYQAFEKAINTSMTRSEFANTAIECSLYLSASKLALFYEQMTQSIRLAKLTQPGLMDHSIGLSLA